jgi:D-sedoheptulose 7-phosphate isomerase
MDSRIKTHFEGHIQTIEAVSRDLSEALERAGTAIAGALRQGKKILVMGNGGSAADAQHLAAEFVGRFLLERKALPAIALTTDSSVLTSIGNDYGYDEVFKRQVEALAVPGDVVLGISTSGMSNNVFHALTAANEIGCTTVGLLGSQGGNIDGIVDLSLIVPARETPFIQEAHLTIIHILCELVETELFAGKA